jgi:hypothetical protein
MKLVLVFVLGLFAGRPIHSHVMTVARGHGPILWPRAPHSPKWPSPTPKLPRLPHVMEVA